MSERVAHWLVNQRALVLAVMTALALVAGVRTVLTYSDLRSELEELLPQHAPSVEALAELRGRLHGTRHLGVVIDTGGAHHVGAANDFVDALAERVREYPEQLVGAVRKDALAEREFAETFALQLLDPGDVALLGRAVEERRDWQVTRATGADLLDDDEDPPPELPLAELRTKYEARYGKQRALPSDRFVSEDGRTVVLLVQASSNATGYAADKALLERVRTDIASLGFPERFAPGMTVGFAGDVATRVEEMEGLGADLGLSGLIVLVLVAAALVSYFRSFLALPLLGLPLLFGTVYAFGLAALPPFSIRHLNSNTAFLGSIVVGNGINSGIILLARFVEARRTLQLEAAIAEALDKTWRPTLAAATAAATAYGSLVVTDFRGFSQFGWIGLFGMLACWASAMTLLPALLALWGRRLTPRAPAGDRGVGRRFAAALLARPRSIVVATTLFTVLCGVGVASRSRDWMEHDFSKLRRADSWESGERYWGARMDATLGRYLTPTIVLSPNATHAARVEAQLGKLRERGGAGDLIASVRSATLVLPAHRSESLVEARRIAEAVTPRLLAELSEDDRRLINRALSSDALTPLSAERVPPVLLAGLREHDGRVDRNVLVFPKLGGNTWDSAVIAEFTRDVRQAAIVDGEPAPVAGSLLLSNDIADAMKADGPRALLVSLGFVLLICLLTFRSLKASLLSMAALFSGVVLMLGVLAWSGQKLNFSNFIAVIISFGISADYAINVLARWRDRTSKDLGGVAATGGAVALCSATTIIGFGSLLAAQNQALFSFGLFAAVGEITCLATAIIALPAALGWLQERRGAERGGVSLETTG